ncbi:uncharacterized protein LOC106096189 [Stomoxys calcitrans]|uniref:uncharacterized protein LOC106096189 n=1 Tax=Stomoxys calcitrans TaxID=35570 RepID=UPI0027E2F3D6|nr:uncharacterized protein LOC106096189 [Stomoxys calcitrans]
MYKISTFDNKLCHVLRHHLDLAGDDCGIPYSIWSFSPATRWNVIYEFFTNKPMCQAAWFPLIYWMVLFISIWGTIRSIIEFIGRLGVKDKGIVLWRKRSYNMLTPSMLCKCRLVGAFVMFHIWLLLSYGIMTVSPHYMMPWLTVNLVTMLFEMITWLLNLSLGQTKMDLHTVCSILLPLAFHWLVACVRNVFRNAIDMKDLDKLRLWPIFK